MKKHANSLFQQSSAPPKIVDKILSKSIISDQKQTDPQKKVLPVPILIQPVQSDLKNPIKLENSQKIFQIQRKELQKKYKKLNDDLKKCPTCLKMLPSQGDIVPCKRFKDCRQLGCALCSKVCYICNIKCCKMHHRICPNCKKPACTNAWVELQGCCINCAKKAKKY